MDNSACKELVKLAAKLDSEGHFAQADLIMQRIAQAATADQFFTEVRSVLDNIYTSMPEDESKQAIMNHLRTVLEKITAYSQKAKEFAQNRAEKMGPEVPFSPTEDLGDIVDASTKRSKFIRLAYDPKRPENIKDDLYAILGLRPDATSKEVLTAYRRLSVKFHPDVAGAAGRDTWDKIQMAKEVLTNPTSRSSYDRAYARRKAAPKPPEPPKAQAQPTPPKAKQPDPPKARTQATTPPPSAPKPPGTGATPPPKANPGPSVPKHVFVPNSGTFSNTPKGPTVPPTPPTPPPTAGVGGGRPHSKFYGIGGAAALLGGGYLYNAFNKNKKQESVPAGYTSNRNVQNPGQSSDASGRLQKLWNVAPSSLQAVLDPATIKSIQNELYNAWAISSKYKTATPEMGKAGHDDLAKDYLAERYLAYGVKNGLEAMQSHLKRQSPEFAASVMQAWNDRSLRNK